MDPQFRPLDTGDPRRIGPFDLLGVLGSGGMGKVYLGQSPGGRRVAVKVVQESLAHHQEFRSRFRREIDAARQMNSLYTAALVDADPDAPLPWMATRYINGRSLQGEVSTDGPMSTRGALEVGVGIAEALEKIHEAGYVHRDLKPSNVVIDQYGPHVIDFGIIMKAAEDSGLTQAGQIIGTPGYMSPEQLAGRRVDSPSDIFSFGATLYYAATGSPPPRVELRDPDVSAVPDPALAELVRHCMTPDPAARPTAPELVGALIAALSPAAATAPVTSSAAGTAAAGAGAAGAGSGTAGPPVATPPTVPPQTVQPRPTPPPALVTALPTPTPVASRPPLQGPAPTGGTGGARPPARRRGVLLAALAATVAVVLTVAFLLPKFWRSDGADPVTTAGAGCGALAANGPTTAVARGADGECYGFTDTARADDAAEAGFGHDPAARQLQAKLFATNRLDLPSQPNDLTVVWFGALTCPDDAGRAGVCKDGRVYDVERQQLQALQLSQARGDLRGRVHVVVANAGSDMRYARELAALLVAHRTALGRVVAIGGGDSRASTKAAFHTLLDAGIPFVTPTLSSDDEVPGLPFIDAPGFVQTTDPNKSWARAGVSFVARYSPRGRQVLVYHVSDPTDLYTESLARDVQFEAGAEPRTSARPARIVSSAAQLPRSICHGTPSTDGSAPPAVFFADRWNTFGAFAAALTALCGPQGPAMVIGNDSVNRFMTNDAARATLQAPWPLAYFKKGVQCSEIAARATADPKSEAATLLRWARGMLRLCDPANGSVQMGDYVATFWDSVVLADRMLPLDGSRSPLADVTLDGSAATLTVTGGRLVRSQGALLQPLCVYAVDRSSTVGRAVGNCDPAFTGR